MKRFQIRLPSWHMKRLIWWSRAKGDSVSGMGGRILQARIEANESQIEGMIADKAQDAGRTVEDIKQQWLNEANYNPADAEDGDSDD